jgi:hypothetical protein
MPPAEALEGWEVQGEPRPPLDLQLAAADSPLPRELTTPPARPIANFNRPVADPTTVPAGQERPSPHSLTNKVRPQRPIRTIPDTFDEQDSVSPSKIFDDQIESNPTRPLDSVASPAIDSERDDGNAISESASQHRGIERRIPDEFTTGLIQLEENRGTAAEGVGSQRGRPAISSDPVEVSRKETRGVSENAATTSGAQSFPRPTVPGQFTWKTAARRLNDLGIRRYRLESLAGQDRFLFTCSVTPSSSLRVTRRFEAEADEPLLAVQKVLEEIDEWQKQR